MILHKGETLFRQGESGPLYRLNSGLLKIVRTPPDGSQFLVTTLTEVLTQDEIGQFIGLRRETINRLLRHQAETKIHSNS